MGFAVSPILRKLIETGHATSHLPFNQLVALLYADCVGPRRNRRNLGEVNIGETANVPIRDHGNPIDWRRETSFSASVPTMSDIVRGYVNGEISTSFFRKFLISKSIEMNPELDLLIRSNESDNGACFQDFACVLLRMGFKCN